MTIPAQLIAQPQHRHPQMLGAFIIAATSLITTPRPHQLISPHLTVPHFTLHYSTITTHIWYLPQPDGQYLCNSNRKCHLSAKPPVMLPGALAHATTYTNNLPPWRYSIFIMATCHPV